MADNPQTGLPAEIIAMCNHHDQLRGELRGDVDGVVATVADGDDVASRQADLAAFVTGEVMPHARAEEDAVYRAGAAVPHLKPLVDGMLMEHGMLAELAEEVTQADSGLAVATAAAAFVALFEVHVAKENELLLPALVAAGADPAELLATMQRAFAARKAEAAAARAAAVRPPAPDRSGLRAAAGEQVVDTRIDTTTSCAGLANDAVDSLGVGDSFLLVSDHDPIAISYMLKAERAGGTSWQVLEDGPARWQVRIRKVAATG